jgi:hypothetical protein
VQGTSRAGSLLRNDHITLRSSLLTILQHAAVVCLMFVVCCLLRAAINCAVLGLARFGSGAVVLPAGRLHLPPPPKLIGLDRAYTPSQIFVKKSSSPKSQLWERKCEHGQLIHHSRAAIEAMPHEHPRLGAVAIGSITGVDFAAMLDRAIQRSGKGRELKQIETTCEEVAPRSVLTATQVSDAAQLWPPPRTE